MKKVMFMVAAAFALVSACKPQPSYISITGYAQGGTYSVKAKILKQKPQQMKSDIDAILKRVDNSLSGYNKNSLVSAFNRGEDIQPDGILCDIYLKSRELWKETYGAMDVACAPLFDLWGFGFTGDSLSAALPCSAVIDSVRRASGMARLKDKMENNSTLMVNSGTAPAKLNFNAVAQGYSCDLIAQYLYSIGIKDMLISIGGEIFCDGRNPKGKNWSIGIDRPIDGNMIPGADMQGVFTCPPKPCGVVTSGNYRKFFTDSLGHKFSHTIDPRTGWPVTHNLLSATITASNATDADAFATACMVMGLEEAAAFISSREDIEGCLIYDKDGKLNCWTSEGFTLEQ